MAEVPLTQLSIRVDAATESELKERAKAAGTNMSDYGRRILRQALFDDRSTERLLDAVAAGQFETLNLRRDLAKAVQALMTMTVAEKKPTPQQIAAWVQTALRVEQ